MVCADQNGETVNESRVGQERNKKSGLRRTKWGRWRGKSDMAI